MTLPITPHHIDVPADAIRSPQPGGRVMLLPGSPGRASRMATRLNEASHFPSDRGHDVWLGTITGPNGPVDVGIAPTGMGCPSVDIIVTELLAVGARCLLRVGTSGSLQPGTIEAGDVVIATAAVRDEGTSRVYAPIEFPAVASPVIVRVAQEASRELSFADRVHTGVVHSKDSLHGREFGMGPLKAENERYMEILSSLGVMASEMEASHLFVLAHAHARSVGAPVHAGCVLAVIGGDAGGPAAAAGDPVDRVIELAFATAARLPAGL